MRVLLVHNYYQQPGGEDVVSDQEAMLLRTAGHTIIEYRRSNAEIRSFGFKQKLVFPRRVIWANDTVQDLRKLLQRKKPDIAHFHNTFLMVSPAAYYAVKAEGIPVVQTLHNYRLFCSNATFFRDGRVCEDCLGKFLPWPGVAHACYRASRPASGVVAAMLTTHRILRTWTEMVDVYIAPTEFARRKFVQGGLPAEKIMVKPNFVHPDPGLGEGRGGYALFVGRLAPEKGISTLLAAWKQLRVRIPLKLIGDGPLADQVAEAAKRDLRIEWLGHRQLKEVYALIGEASMLIFPSEWYETFGRGVIEALT